MIDLATGQILFASGASVAPGFTPGDLEASPFARTAERGNAPQPPWDTYTVGRHDLDGVPVLVTLAFYDGHLRSVDMYLVDDSETASWADWSEKRERNRKARGDKLLRAVLGSPPYKYPWGSISSVYDPKSGFSNIVVTYVTPL